MTLYEILIEPFADFAFMRRALAASIALSIGAAPIGVLLILRRMSLMGDAMSHAILPGAAIGFLVAGSSLIAMSLGGMIAGLFVVLAAGLIARTTSLREDASLAGFYLTSLALGVLIISVSGSNADLLHLLFGSILAVDDLGLFMVAVFSSVTVLAMAVIYRPLLVESFDPVFLRAAGGGGVVAHGAFLMLFALNLVAGFQALGTLMSVGLMMLPAAAARLWAREAMGLILIAAGFGLSASIAGLLISYHFDLPSGATIILSASAIYFFSIITGREGGWLWRILPGAHVHEIEAAEAHALHHDHKH